MVFGMASVKITITLEQEQLDQVRALVGVGRAASVSGFVKHAVATSLDDVAAWTLAIEDALAGTGGPLTTDERRWADEVLGTPAPKSPTKPRHRVA
jgi:Arc/MetJ-type ribon-helix-helix transcriptional regulator